MIYGEPYLNTFGIFACLIDNSLTTLNILLTQNSPIKSVKKVKYRVYSNIIIGTWPFLRIKSNGDRDS